MKGNLKRILTFALLAVLLAAADLPLPGLPADARADGDFAIWNGILLGYTGSGGDVRIPDGVTAIGKRAFYACESLTGVTIPKGVRSIGEEAFSCCFHLERVVLPSTLKTIGDLAFCACRSLLTIAIPKGVKEIGEGTFRDCDSLKKVVLPGTLEAIGPCAFIRCSSLINITIPRNVTEIGRQAFDRCTSLPRVTIPNTVKVIGDRAFAGCTNLEKVTLSEGVTLIGKGVFAYCVSLTGVILPNTVQLIGDGAFADCTSLEKVTLPKGIMEIGEETFISCGNLTDITIPNTVQGIEDAAFEGCTSLTRVTIGNGVTTIGEYAFRSCTGLTSIVIPDSVTTIAANAFDRCENLRLVTLPADLQEPPVLPGGDTQTTVIPDDLLPPMIVLKVGQSMALPRFKGARVSWRVADPSMAYIVKNRTVRGLKAGAEPTTLILKVEAAQGKALTLDGQPLKPGREYGIELIVLGMGVPTARKAAISPTRLTLHPLGSDYGYPAMADLDLFLTPASLPDFWFRKSNCCYTSSNPQVAQVLHDGTVCAIKPGKATIRVYTPNMKTASVTVTVKGWVTSLRLKNQYGDYVTRVTMPALGYYCFTPEFNEDAALKKVRWTSSNPAVARVYGDKIETTREEGKAVITATALDGSNKRASVIVRVTMSES